MKDTAKRMKRRVKSPIIQHLLRKCRFFTTVINPNHSQCNYFAFECNKIWNVSHIVKGVSRLEDDVIVEYGSGRIVWVDVNKKELLEVEGVDLNELQHNEILDLSVEGDRWDGDVLNGNPCGWGVLFDKNNERVYEGFRIDEKNVCYGRTYYSNVLRVEYEGEWCDGMRWGRGVQYDRNGVVVYDGEWLNDAPLKKRVEVTSASVLLHNHVEELHVIGGCCNEEGLKELDLSGFMNLRELNVANECFEYVKKVNICGLRELERMIVGSKSFTKEKDECLNEKDGRFYLKNCPRLRELRITGVRSFSDYSVIEIENVDALEVIEMGELNEMSYNFMYASLELKSLLIHNE